MLTIVKCRILYAYHFQAGEYDKVDKLEKILQQLYTDVFTDENGLGKYYLCCIINDSKILSIKSIVPTFA